MSQEYTSAWDYLNRCPGDQTFMLVTKEGDAPVLFFTGNARQAQEMASASGRRLWRLEEVKEFPLAWQDVDNNGKPSHSYYPDTFEKIEAGSEQALDAIEAPVFPTKEKENG